MLLIEAHPPPPTAVGGVSEFAQAWRNDLTAVGLRPTEIGNLSLVFVF